MKILFSPVGGTDPISENNYRDGSLLHICRYYKPDVVYLYMSKEILDKEEKDKRYTRAIKLLGQDLKIEIGSEIIRRPKLQAPNEYDYFYNDFKECINSISKKLKQPDDCLLLNVSSGTPAMKSALIVMQTISECNSIAIQVSTPEKKMNEHTHSDNYDLDAYWKENEDNYNNINRCKEISCPSLSVLRDEQIIKKLIEQYNYEAALLMAESLPLSETQNYYDLIRLAKARYDLNWEEVKRIDDSIPFAGSSANMTSDQRKVFEYALLLDIKRKRGDLGDFVRAITPLVTVLYDRILSYTLDISVNDFCSRDNNIRKWDEGKLAASPKGVIIRDILTRKSKSKSFDVDVVYSSHMAEIILSQAEDTNLQEIVKNTQKVEHKVRNWAAHELVSISDRDVQQKCGRNSSGIMNLIKKLIQYTDFASMVDWKSYEEMNREIIKRIGLQR